MIRWIKNTEVNRGKWDATVAGSLSETLYPYSWYLDAVAGRWEALVVEDYRYIMPVIPGRKFGIRYLYHPPLCQQLGVVSREFADPLLVSDLIGRLVRRYRMGTVQLNTRNMIGENPSWTATDRTNFILSLDREHPAIESSYSENTRRNLRRCMEAGLVLDTGVKLGELMLLKERFDPVPQRAAHYRWLERVLGSIMEQGKGKILGFRKGSELVAGLFLATSLSRIIYLLSVSSPAGKELRAMFGLVDHVVRSHEGSGKVLDFEGSTIPGIARFFSGFGAVPETYQAVHFDRLPGIIKRLKGNHG